MTSKLGLYHKKNMPKPEEKFLKNVKFSRTKKFANSEADIAKNEAALNNWKNERKKEREQNLVAAAGGKVDRADDDKVEHANKVGYDDNDHAQTFVYYTKMNLIVENLPYNYSVSKLCKTFEQLGSILCVSTDPKESAKIPHEYYDAKVIPNEWSDLISAVQQEIFETGYSEYEIGNGVVCKIVCDPNQKKVEYGEAIEYY
jgi:hypothetical protein